MDLMPREANPDAPITAYRYNVYDWVTEFRDCTKVLLASLVASQKHLIVSNLAYCAFWVLFLL
jgi:hypothetical protein